MTPTKVLLVEERTIRPVTISDWSEVRSILGGSIESIYISVSDKDTEEFGAIVFKEFYAREELANPKVNHCITRWLRDNYKDSIGMLLGTAIVIGMKPLSKEGEGNAIECDVPDLIVRSFTDRIAERMRV